MKNQSNKDYLKGLLFENKVALMFVVLCAFAFWQSGMSTVMFFNEIAIRFGRETFIVLALLIPVVAGLGLNFGIVLGAMSAQIAMFIVIVLGGSGVPGLFTIALVATPIAILFGFLVGILFNKMKGSEMIGGMVTSLFADGFYQLLFLWVLGGVIPIAYARVMTSTGVGVLNTINLDTSPTYMRQALDNILMVHILEFAMVGIIGILLFVVIFRLIKKQPINLTGEKNIKKPLVVLGILAVVFVASGLSGRVFVNPLTHFLFQDRLNALFTIQWGALVMVLFIIYNIIRRKVIRKEEGIPFKQIFQLVFVGIIFSLSFVTAIYIGLENLGLPVFTYLLIVALCAFIKWFMNTRLGQNMRTVGQSRPVATAAGINVDRTRVIAMIISTLLAAYGQIIVVQNFGVLNTYGQHRFVGTFAIAALLVGGATVTKATARHAILGVVLFHSLFILAPIAGTNLTGSGMIGEYFRVFVSYAVIAVALIMHAWKQVKRKKEEEIVQEHMPTDPPAIVVESADS
jgi:simple sugar transport system permease protein